MFLLIIQWSVISLVLIILIHYLYGFFKDTLTIPKTKDLVNRPVDVYKEMYEIINKKDTSSNQQEERNKGNDIVSMKDELKSYLNNLNHTTGVSSELDYAGTTGNQFGFAI